MIDPTERKRRNAAHQRKWRHDNPKEALAIGQRARATRPTRDPVGFLLARSRQRAAFAGLEFDLDRDAIVIPTHCPILGVELKIGGRDSNCATVDRVDNNRGYVKGNVAVISHRANVLKGDGTVEQFESVLRFMRSHGGSGHGIR